MYSNSNSNNGSPGEMAKADHYEPEQFEGFEDVHIKHEKVDDW